MIGLVLVTHGRLAEEFVVAMEHVVGKQERIEAIARSDGLAELSLETAEMAEGNIRLYRRHGFEIVRRGPPSHGMDAHMRVFMVKPL